jgi:hypothetical protein
MVIVRTSAPVFVLKILTTTVSFAVNNIDVIFEALKYPVFRAAREPICTNVAIISKKIKNK